MFWLDEVDCKGDEKHIAECKSNPWGVHDCSYYEAVGIVCGEYSTTADDNNVQVYDDIYFNYLDRSPRRNHLAYTINHTTAVPLPKPQLSFTSV